MAGLVPAIHVLQGCVRVDARDKPGHDDKSTRRSAPAGTTSTTVIVGFNPTIHAMTGRKHCPRNRPFAGVARQGRAVCAPSVGFADTPRFAGEELVRPGMMIKAPGGALRRERHGVHAPTRNATRPPVANLSMSWRGGVSRFVSERKGF
jgi:hypothetical protein